MKHTRELFTWICSKCGYEQQEIKSIDWFFCHNDHCQFVVSLEDVDLFIAGSARQNREQTIEFWADFFNRWLSPIQSEDTTS